MRKSILVRVSALFAFFRLCQSGRCSCFFRGIKLETLRQPCQRLLASAVILTAEDGVIYGVPRTLKHKSCVRVVKVVRIVRITIVFKVIGIIATRLAGPTPLPPACCVIPCPKDELIMAVAWKLGKGSVLELNSIAFVPLFLFLKAFSSDVLSYRTSLSTHFIYLCGLSFSSLHSESDFTDSNSRGTYRLPQCRPVWALEERRDRMTRKLCSPCTPMTRRCRSVYIKRCTPTRCSERWGKDSCPRQSSSL